MCKATAIQGEMGTAERTSQLSEVLTLIQPRYTAATSTSAHEFRMPGAAGTRRVTQNSRRRVFEGRQLGDDTGQTLTAHPSRGLYTSSESLTPPA